jgi:hypothetical protein
MMIAMSNIFGTQALCTLTPIQSTAHPLSYVRTCFFFMIDTWVGPNSMLGVQSLAVLYKPQGGLSHWAVLTGTVSFS